MDSNLLKTKTIEQLVGDVEHGAKALKRTLSALDLTLLGIGAIIGTGIFVLTGTAAANQAGPGIVLSYVLAGTACGFAALCYAEFAAMIPIAGSAYTYAYATLGEIFAWMIGWDLILEYAVGSMTVAVGWSGYFQRILMGFGVHLPAWMSAAPGTQVVMADGSIATALFNLPAMLIVLAIMVLLVVGVRESARFNAAMVAIKLAAVVFFIVVGVGYVNPPNWSPFAPYGWSGIMTGGRGRVLRLHRIRRRIDHCGRGQEPQPRSADWHHRVARDLHAVVFDCRRHPQWHRPGRPVPDPRMTCSSSMHPSAMRSQSFTRIGRPVSCRPAPWQASRACCSSCS